MSVFTIQHDAEGPNEEKIMIVANHSLNKDDPQWYLYVHGSGSVSNTVTIEPGELRALADLMDTYDKS